MTHKNSSYIFHKTYLKEKTKSHTSNYHILLILISVSYFFMLIILNGGMKK
jgi:hypothetical protein